MRDYKHLTRFPAADKTALDRATRITGLSVNQIILQSLHGYLPTILQQHETKDLSPLPDSAVEKALAQMTAEEVADVATLSRASARPKSGDLD